MSAEQRPAGVPAGGSSPAVRVPFGTYLPAPLHREFKAACAIVGMEMQEAVAEAVAEWLEARVIR